MFLGYLMFCTLVYGDTDMNANNPDAKPVMLDPITYHIEDYEPEGMEGIFISECWLDINIINNEVEISQISFPADRQVNSLIPRSFEQALIKVMHADKKLMEDIETTCAEEYSNNNW
jgi:hypothetical protein